MRMGLKDIYSSGLVKRAPFDSEYQITWFDVGNHFDPCFMKMCNHPLKVWISFGIHGENTAISIFVRRITGR